MSKDQIFIKNESFKVKQIFSRRLFNKMKNFLLSGPAKNQRR
jgi:hypothetical protein